MKKLILKDEFKGLIITTNILGIGSVTLDTNKIEEAKFEKYLALGFNIFDEVEVEEELDEATLLDIIANTPIENNIEFIETPIQYYGVTEPKENKRGRKPKK